jgi:hypothetical protein
VHNNNLTSSPPEIPQEAHTSSASSVLLLITAIYATLKQNLMVEDVPSRCDGGGGGEWRVMGRVCDGE